MKSSELLMKSITVSHGHSTDVVKALSEVLRKAEKYDKLNESMSNNKYRDLSLDRTDVFMLLLVGDELFERIGDQAYNILIESPFLDKLQDDSKYVHEYQASYWAKWIVEWYDINKVK